MKIKVSEKATTMLIVISSIVWLAIVILSFMGKSSVEAGFVGLLLSVVIIFIYYFLGGVTRGEIDAGVPFLYPILINCVLMAIAYVIVYATKGKEYSNFILGMHPGMFWSILIWWVGTLLTTTLSYYLFFNKSLPEEDWDTFLKEVEDMKRRTGK
jgi:ABC-type Fe3+-siderophore transport system permease subunit